MGFSHSWIAVEGLEPEQAITALGLEVSAAVAPEDFPEGIAIGKLPNGWLIALTDRRASAFEGKLVELAALGTAVACAMHETVMYSEARGYTDGEQIWRVVHDPNEDETLYSLEVDGNLPQQFDSIAQSARAEQDSNGGDQSDVDFMFDIPPKLAQSICGFMLGEREPEGFYFTELRTVGGAKTERSFFARLFGRG